MGTRGIFEGKYRDISDDSPEEVVRKIQGQYPGVGRKMLKGHPKSQGLTLLRERTGLYLLRLDPTAVLQDGSLDPRPNLLCAMSSSPLAYR